MRLEGFMENLELIAAILAAGVVSQKSSMSPEKAMDEAITAYSQITAKLVQLEAKQKQLKNAA
jgi:outer membrane murein-binding lipoprotein Lpp